MRIVNFNFPAFKRLFDAREIMIIEWRRRRSFIISNETKNVIVLSGNKQVEKIFAFVELICPKHFQFQKKNHYYQKHHVTIKNFTTFMSINHI